MVAAENLMARFVAYSRPEMNEYDLHEHRRERTFQVCTVPLTLALVGWGLAGIILARRKLPMHIHV